MVSAAYSLRAAASKFEFAGFRVTVTEFRPRSRERYPAVEPMMNGRPGRDGEMRRCQAPTRRRPVDAVVCATYATRYGLLKEYINNVRCKKRRFRKTDLSRPTGLPSGDGADTAARTFRRRAPSCLEIAVDVPTDYCGDRIRRSSGDCRSEAPSPRRRRRPEAGRRSAGRAARSGEARGRRCRTPSPSSSRNSIRRPGC